MGFLANIDMAFLHHGDSPGVSRPTWTMPTAPWRLPSNLEGSRRQYPWCSSVGLVHVGQEQLCSLHVAVGLVHVGKDLEGSLQGAVGLVHVGQDLEGSLHCAVVALSMLARI